MCGCLPSLFFLMNLWLCLCVYKAKWWMLEDTCLPSRHLALEEHTEDSSLGLGEPLFMEGPHHHGFPSTMK